MLTYSRKREQQVPQSLIFYSGSTICFQFANNPLAPHKYPPHHPVFYLKLFKTKQRQGNPVSVNNQLLACHSFAQ